MLIIVLGTRKIHILAVQFAPNLKWLLSLYKHIMHYVVSWSIILNSFVAWTMKTQQMPVTLP